MQKPVGSGEVTDEPQAAGDTDAKGRHGQPESWDTLTVDEFQAMTTEIAQPMMAAALRLTRRRQEAEDLVQESLYRGLRSLKSFRKGSRFRAWMFRILHNVFINRIRRERMAPTAVDPADLSPADVAHPVPDIGRIEDLPGVSDRHLDDRVKAAIEALPETFRVPFVLFSLGAMSYAEIAETLGIPIGTVMSRLHRARRYLRKDLTDYAREHGYETGEE